MYAKPYEKYCREHFPDRAEDIFEKAEKYYREFKKDMTDLGENMMAKNMLDWFTILSFYEASGHELDGNKSKWPYRLFEKTYVKFNRMQKEHQEKGEWMDSWKVEIMHA